MEIFDKNVTLNELSLKQALDDIRTPIEWENFVYKVYYGECLITITGNDSRKDGYTMLHANIRNIHTNDEVDTHYSISDRLYYDKPLIDILNLKDWVEKIKGTAGLLQ